MTGSWLPVLAFAAATNPIAIGAGIVIGILARHGWRLILAPVLAAAILMLWSRGIAPGHLTGLVMLSALLWAAAASGLRALLRR